VYLRDHGQGGSTGRPFFRGVSSAKSNISRGHLLELVIDKATSDFVFAIYIRPYDDNVQSCEVTECRLCIEV